MCYTVFLSTSSPEDLSAYSTELVHFERPRPDDSLAAILSYEHKWFVGSKSGCSCTFRHLSNADLGFGPPEEWFPENTTDIAATMGFMATVRRLIASGHTADCVDAWDGTAAKDIRRRTVDVRAVADEEFRFFENWQFVFTRGSS